MSTTASAAAASPAISGVRHRFSHLPSLSSHPRSLRPSAIAFSLSAVPSLPTCPSEVRKFTAAYPGEEEEKSSCGKGFKLPPKELMEIADAPLRPIVSYSPRRDRALFLKRNALRTLEDLAAPTVGLAGLRIDVHSNSRFNTPYYTGLAICQVLDEGRLGPEKEIQGIPDGAKIRHVKWSYDGRHLAFSVQADEGDNRRKLKMWLADLDTGIARPLFPSSSLYLNAVFCSYVWMDDSMLVVSTITDSRGDPPRRPFFPLGPKIHCNEQQNVVRAGAFPLKDKYDENLFDYYATSQLILVSLDGEMKTIGTPAVYISFYPSPDQKFLLVSSIHRPYSYAVPFQRFPRKVELWKAHGNFVRELCDLPLSEDTSKGSVRKGKRLIHWRSDKPSTLCWVETQDGGNPEVEVSPRDIIYTEPAKLVGDRKPKILHKLTMRYVGISWCDDSLALVGESCSKTGKDNIWIISPGFKDVAPRLLFPGSRKNEPFVPRKFVMRRTPAGTHLLARVTKAGQGNYILLRGSGITPAGRFQFLDLLDINTGKKERIWQGDKKKYREIFLALVSDHCNGDLPLDQLTILSSKESSTDSIQYYLQFLSVKKAFQITQFPHPHPKLPSVQRELIRYQGKDGVQFSTTLFLPPNYILGKDEPLPCLFWVYPLSEGLIERKASAEQFYFFPNKFQTISPTSPLLWLVRGFAVLSGPVTPVIPKNNRNIEWLVDCVEGAVSEIVRRGVVHADKIVLCGHSYGANITANLLARSSHLFCCGIARSGAYNRSLTPFGFQYEYRTLWEATDAYVEMSPLMFANKVKKPILLIHGEVDGNFATRRMQSEQFFKALRGNSVPCRLVILPFEGHRYASRENIMHVLWEMDRWLNKYCLTSPSTSSGPEGSKTDMPQDDAENLSDAARHSC